MLLYFKPNNMFAKLIFVSLSFFLLINKTEAQIKEPSYILTLMKAKYLDSTNPKQIMLVFKHQSKSRTIERLIISGKLTFSFGKGSEKTEILGQGENHHQIEVFGNDIEVKDKYIFNLVKANPSFSTEDDVRYLVFRLQNLTDKYINNMTFTYGLWEPVDSKTRIETKYQISIDK